MLELARPSDRQAVETLARQVHGLHVSWRPDIYEMVPEIYPEERFLNEIKGRNLYVARLNGCVVGYVLLAIRPYEGPGMVKRRVMAVQEVCVEESCRRQGIGRAMMTDVRALARAFGCDSMQLGVYPQNDEAVSFYQKCGFRIRSISMDAQL